jgi:hypothetical protein
MAISLQRELSFDRAGWQRLVDAVIQIITGRQNSTGELTLNVAPATTTVVSFVNCSKDCEVFLSSRTANAAAAMGTTFIKKSDIGQGSFTITHASSAQSDRTFGFICIGG